MTFDPPTVRQVRWVSGGMAAVMAGVFVDAVRRLDATDAITALGAVIVLAHGLRHPQWYLRDVRAVDAETDLDVVDRSVLAIAAIVVVAGLLLRWLS
jgi:hypothetical protein